ncbi:hypothetical protein pdam_00025422, partial [Pocillopora damicornis]
MHSSRRRCKKDQQKQFRYEAETYDVVIVISQTPQADPEARAQPSFKNLYTLKFRCLFVAVSVISVASLLKAAATLVLASAMMM